MEVCLMAGWFLSIGEKSYPIRMDSLNLRFSAGAEGKHQASSCQLATRGSDALSTIMYATGLLDAKVLDGEGKTAFTGVIRPYASITANQMHLSDLQLEVLDFTEKLHKKVYAEPDEDYSSISPDVVYEQNWDGYKVLDTGNTSKSIVHQLCLLAGITLSTSISIDVTLNRFSLKSGQYLDDVLGKLLYEYVYDYRFDKDGVMHIIQTGTITKVTIGDDGKVQGSATVSDLQSAKTLTLFRNQLDISRADEAKDGALVKYDKYKEVSDELVYEESFGGWGGIVAVDTVWASGDKDVKWDLSRIKEDDDGKEIILKNFWIEGKDESWGVADVWINDLELSGCDDEGGHIKYSLGAAAGLFIHELKFFIRVFADVSYTKAESKTVGYSGENAEEYTAEYIESLEHAVCLASAIRNRGKYGNFTYKFESYDLIEPGTVITIDEKDISGLTAVVRITERSLSNDYGLYGYEAEGYGSTEFQAPAIDRDDDLSLPQNQPDFFLMNVFEETVIPDAADTEPISAMAWGAIFSKYGATPKWYLNGTLMEYTDLRISFSKLMLAPGINRLRCEAVYDGETYYVEKGINCIATDTDISMEFAVLDEGQSPDSSTVWSATQPVPLDGQVVWMRFKTTTSADWIVIRMTGENGKTPVVYFRWGDSPVNAPEDGLSILAWDDMAITWETDGDVMAFVIEDAGWSTVIPDKPLGYNYLWVRFWNYTDQKWETFCTTGSPAIDFNLIVNPSTFRLTSRGVTKPESSEVYEDTCQRIIARCQRLNTTAPITWEVTPEDEDLLTWARVDDDDDSQIEIVIKPLVALPSINIHCSIADIDTAKDFLCTGVQEGKADQMYLGIISSTATFPVKTSEGPLMVGDHILVEAEDGSRVPYYYTGQPGDDAWVVSGLDMPISFGFKVLQNTLWDGLKSGKTADVLSALNIFAANIGTNLFFSYFAKIRNLLVGDGSLFSFEVYDYQNGENVTPVIRAVYDGKTVFQIDPSTGNVFFGQPNSNLTAPSTGFMYRASDQSIVSAGERFKVDADGHLSAIGADIAGTVTADSLKMAIAGGNTGVSSVSAKFYKFTFDRFEATEYTISIPSDAFVVISQSVTTFSSVTYHTANINTSGILGLSGSVEVISSSETGTAGITVSYDHDRSMLVFSRPTTAWPKQTTANYIIWVYS